MPVAKATGLKLVSPSTTMKTNGPNPFGWFVTFLKTCWELDTCDVKTIDVIAMHHYTCFHEEMVDTYDAKSKSEKSFYQKLIQELTDPSWKGHNQFDWESYVLSRPIWFTEHSCEGEHWESKKYPADVNSVQSCDRIMCKRGADWGAGSVQAIKDMDNAHRLSWFVAFTRQKEFADSAMFNWGGDLLPIARALFNDLDPSKVDCEAAPTALYV